MHIKKFVFRIFLGILIACGVFLIPFGFIADNMEKVNKPLFENIAVAYTITGISSLALTLLFANWSDKT